MAPPGCFVLLVVAIGTALTLLGLGLVQAATARALIEIDSDRPVGPVHAYGWRWAASARCWGRS